MMARPPSVAPFFWRRIFQRLRWIAHPITIFVGLQIVWLALLLMWVIWFVGQQESIAALAQRFGGEYFDKSTVIVMLIVGCVLLGVLLVGTIVLFAFGQRQTRAAQQQRTFVSSVTHELKSPLASLQLAFETMVARKLPEEHMSRLLEMIHTDIERLSRLVDQILVAGRLDRGLHFDDEGRHEIPVAELIDKISDKLSYLDPNVKARLAVHCPDGFTLVASRSALTLILNNLIENAIKYSPRDAKVEVEVTPSDSEVILKVKDSGHGIEKRDMRRIFKMFHRSESAIKKAIPGTGLGLFIVKSAVSLLGGKIYAESSGKGHGSTFTVLLPISSKKLQPARA